MMRQGEGLRIIIPDTSTGNLGSSFGSELEGILSSFLLGLRLFYVCWSSSSNDIKENMHAF
jgi:hypothetical protein